MKKTAVLDSKKCLSRTAQGTVAKLRMARNRRADVQCLVRFVANIGENADYNTQPRISVGLSLPFTPGNRNSARQLRELVRQVRSHAGDYLPAGGLPCLAHRSADQSTRPVRHRLAGRSRRTLHQGRSRRLNRRLLPQVFGEQSVPPSRFVVGPLPVRGVMAMTLTTTSTSTKPSTNCWIRFRSFEQVPLVDANHDDDCLSVVGECWHTFPVDLPFTPTPKSSAAQLRYIEAAIQRLQCVVETVRMWKLRSLDDRPQWGSQPVHLRPPWPQGRHPQPEEDEGKERRLWIGSRTASRPSVRAA